MKDYKNVWNGLSGSFEDAAFYVTLDQEEEDIRRNGAITAQFLKEVLEIGPEDRVLEIGCGIARVGRELAPLCGEWHGADISGNMIAYAAERTRGVPNVHLHEQPDSSLGIFPDGYFDVVYSTIVFMHLDKLDMFGYMKEALRVLAPGGRAYFDTYNILGDGAWGEFINLHKVYSPGRRPQHMSQFSTPQEMERLMQKAGFDTIDVSGDNEVLVVGRGRKPAQDGWVRPALAVREYTAESAGDANGADGEETQVFNMAEVLNLTGANKSLRAEADGLALEFHSQAEYVRKLEQTLGEKNAYLEELETRLQEVEMAQTRLPRVSLSGITGLLVLVGNVVWAAVLWKRARELGSVEREARNVSTGRQRR